MGWEWGTNLARIITVPDPDLEIRRGGGSSRPLDEGVGADLQKKIFWPLGPQFGLKWGGGGGGLGPSLDPPLYYIVICCCKGCIFALASLNRVSNKEEVELCSIFFKAPFLISDISL